MIKALPTKQFPGFRSVGACGISTLADEHVLGCVVILSLGSYYCLFRWNDRSLSVKQLFCFSKIRKRLAHINSRFCFGKFSFLLGCLAGILAN